MIHQGSCVIHSWTKLQKVPRRPIAYKDVVLSSPTKVLLDTRIATLGRGSILYTPKQEDENASDSQKGSSKPNRPSYDIDPIAFGNEYAVADSPVVEAFTIQLFPGKPHAGLPALYRCHEYYAVVLVGKNGLSALRDFLVLQRESRAENAVFTGRLATASLPKEPAGELSPRIIKPRLHLETAVITVNGPSTGSTKLTKFLQARRLPHQQGQVLQNPSPLAGLYGLSPRSRTDQSIMSPPKSRLMFGSFQMVSEKNGDTLPLIAAKPCSDIRLQQQTIPSRPLTTASTTAGVIDQQLREEQRVFTLLSNQSAFSREKNVNKEKQVRRRNGHLPLKVVENAGKFVDEHAFTTVINLKDVHARKKSGLCRRLLHIKGQSTI